VRLGLFLLGSFIGAPTRYLIDQYFRSYMKFPLGILIVNVSGAFLLGVVANSETDIAFSANWSLANEIEEKPSTLQLHLDDVA